MVTCNSEMETNIGQLGLTVNYFYHVSNIHKTKFTEVVQGKYCSFEKEIETEEGHTVIGDMRISLREYGSKAHPWNYWE